MIDLQSMQVPQTDDDDGLSNPAFACDGSGLAYLKFSKKVILSSNIRE
jgi:hypothetical protein